MKTNFTPHKLNQAVVEISQKHPLKSLPPEYKSDQAFVAMLKNWAQMPQSDVTQEAAIIPPRRLRQLVEYVSSNSLNLPMDNLITIIRLRVTEEMFRRMISLWQDAYRNPDFNNLLDRILQDNQILPERVFQGSQLTSNIFSSWLGTANTPILVGKTCLQFRTKTNSFENALHSFLISPESLLGKQCIEQFYTYCAREDYILVKDLDLKRILNRYDTSQINSFLKNFLSKLSIQDFAPYYATAKYLISNYTDLPDTKRFTQFFNHYSQDLIGKYRRWLNYITIRDSFHNNTSDVRLIFWSKFVPYMDNSYMEQTSNALIMFFEHYSIIEFTETTMGALYIYEKNDFAKRIQPQTRRKNNTELRSFLYNSPYEERIVHNGNWQSRTERYLRRNRIARR